MTSLFFDIVMAGLLIVAIVFCYRLNGRLKTMRKMGAELTPFMKNMSNYLGQISQAIDKLKQISDLGNQGLNEHIPVAINLKDDFDLLLEYSEKMANRLEEIIEKAREADQRLQQTLRIAEGSRSNDHRIEPTFQKTVEHPQQKTSPQQRSHHQQEPFTRDHFTDDRLSMASAPLLKSEREKKDYFVPSQSSPHNQRQPNSAHEHEQSSSVGRGIMAKLRGLR